MSAIFRLPKSLWSGGVILAFSLTVFGQATVTNSGGEFSILGMPAGDQVAPSLALSPSGGCLVWQDNVIDKYGWGLGGVLLDANFTPSHSFRINRAAVGDQVKPQVQMLADGRMLTVWECSVAGTPQIYGRFARNTKDASAYGTNFYTGDLRINTYVTDQQVDPAVAALADGGAIVTWSSYGEDGSMWGVFARKLNAQGRAVAVEKGKPARQFQVNQFASYNQRNPAVAALANGNFVVVWISEGERSSKSVDVYARIFTESGVPVTDEIPVNSALTTCASPAVAPLGDGGFTVVWAQADTVATNGLDILGRAFASSGSPQAADFKINTYLYGDQYSPKIAAGPAGSLVIWTSMGQDGSREGVYGRFLSGGVQVSGGEFRVNTTTISQQIHPTVAWNGTDRFLVVWSSFSGASGFDLYGQAYSVTASP